jgi:hypothetical protein
MQWRGPGRPVTSAAMDKFAQRLAQRHAQLGLNGRHTAERAGMKYPTFKKLLAGQSKSLPHPDTLARLCDALALTPRQALGLDPIAGVDEGTTATRRDLLLDRVRAGLTTLDEPGLAAAERLLPNLYPAADPPS